MAGIFAETPREVAGHLAGAVRALRLERSWTRRTLATRAGVSVASLKRFENSGKASLDLLLKVAHALQRLDEFARLLQPALARSLTELEEKTRERERKRGSR